MALPINKSLATMQLSAFSIYLYSIYYHEVMTPIPSTPQRKVFGHFKFLTYWDLLLQFGFFTLVIVNNLINSKDLTKVIDLIFYSLALPVSMMVASTFWALYAIDRELILPKALDPYFPTWLNHSVHTLVFVFSLLELVFGKHDRPCKQASLKLMLVFMVTYCIWLLYIALGHDVWVYPFLEILNWPQRIAFCLSCILYSYGLFNFGYWIGGRKSDQTKSKMKKNF